jgi:ketosteroid isomerase-like protein
MYEALRAADLPTVIGLLHPDFRGCMTEGLPFGIGGVHVGPEAMLVRCWAVVAEHYDLTPAPDDVAELADGRVLVLGRYRGTGRSTGKPVDAAFAHVLTVDGGRIVRWQAGDRHGCLARGPAPD